MEVPRPFVWTRSVRRAMALQERLAAQVVLRGRVPRCRLAAGIDAAYDPGGRRMVAAVVVVTVPEGALVEAVWARGAVRFPYVPGLLSFREVPVILRAWRRLRTTPDVVLCDGQGFAHPRRFGLACHVGYCLDLPTVGCAKSQLVGTHGAVGRGRGSWSWLRDGRERIGIVLRTRTDVKPVYVSPGYRIGFRSAATVVLRTTTGFRLPEPIRRADHLVAELVRGPLASRGPAGRLPGDAAGRGPGAARRS